MYAVFNTPKRYIIASIICAVVVGATIVICAATRHVSEYIVIPILICVYFVPQMFSIRGARTLVVDVNQCSYEVCTALKCCVTDGQSYHRICPLNYAVQGHSRSPILVPIENSYATSH